MISYSNEFDQLSSRIRALGISLDNNVLYWAYYDVFRGKRKKKNRIISKR